MAKLKQYFPGSVSTPLESLCQCASLHLMAKDCKEVKMFAIREAAACLETNSKMVKGVKQKNRANKKICTNIHTWKERRGMEELRRKKEKGKEE